MLTTETRALPETPERLAVRGTLAAHDGGDPPVYTRNTTFHLDISGEAALGLIMGLARGAIARRGGDPARVHVLDLGCGTGQVSIPLAALGINVLGIDLDLRSVEAARRWNPFRTATFECADAEAVEVDRQYDLVICTQMLDHVSRPEKVCRAAVASLRDDGVLVVGISNGYGPYEVSKRVKAAAGVVLGKLGVAGILRLLGSMFAPLWRRSESWQRLTANPFTYSRSPHIHKYTLRTLTECLGKAGLERLEVHKYTLLLPAYPLSILFFALPYRVAKAVEALDLWLAEHVPACCSSNWYLVCRRAGAGTNPRGAGGSLKD
jgi:2-polyprenyl-3-methyl-5-hydroxy-6-metoxy-1,4-benzoquinol methylase